MSDVASIPKYAAPRNKDASAPTPDEPQDKEKTGLFPSRKVRRLKKANTSIKSIMTAGTMPKNRP